MMFKLKLMAPTFIGAAMLFLSWWISWGSNTAVVKALPRGLITHSYTGVQNCIYVFESPDHSIAAVTVARINGGTGDCNLELK